MHWFKFLEISLAFSRTANPLAWCTLGHCSLRRLGKSFASKLVLALKSSFSFSKWHQFHSLVTSLSSRRSMMRHPWTFWGWHLSVSSLLLSKPSLNSGFLLFFVFQHERHDPRSTKRQTNKTILTTRNTFMVIVNEVKYLTKKKKEKKERKKRKKKRCWR